MSATRISITVLSVKMDCSDDPNAIDSFLDMFIYFWEQGIPVDDVN